MPKPPTIVRVYVVVRVSVPCMPVTVIVYTPAGVLVGVMVRVVLLPTLITEVVTDAEAPVPVIL